MKSLGKLMGQLTILAVLIATIFGCATVQSGFTPTTKVNLAPFADQTIALLGNPDSSFSKDESVLIKRYVNENDPEVKRLFALEEEIDRLFRSVMAYSVEIVTLSESSLATPKKVKAFSEYLEKFEKSIISKPQIEVSEEQFKEMLANVRKQEKFLDALNAAQPLINESARYGDEVLNEIEKNLINLAFSIDDKIDSEYQYLTNFSETLGEQKKAVIQGLELVHDYRAGDQTALKRLIDSKVIKKESIVAKGSIASKDVMTIEKYLIDRLVTFRQIDEQLAPDIKLWKDTHKELDGLLKDLVTVSRRGRTAINTWARAHHKMALGVADPAKWFDIGAAPSTLFKLGIDAVF